MTATGAPSPRWGRTAAVVVAALATRPSLWPAALGALHRLARPGWWRRWPLLPVPDPSYWRFRLVTAYGGDGGTVPRAEDVVAYLSWCRGMGTGRG